MSGKTGCSSIREVKLKRASMEGFGDPSEGTLAHVESWVSLIIMGIRDNRISIIRLGSDLRIGTFHRTLCQPARLSQI